MTGVQTCALPISFTLTLDRFEVDEAFEVPFAFFLDPANRRQENVVRGGVARTIYAFPYEGRNIWGFTARILARVAAIVRGED